MRHGSIGGDRQRRNVDALSGNAAHRSWSRRMMPDEANRIGPACRILSARHVDEMCGVTAEHSVKKDFASGSWRI